MSHLKNPPSSISIRFAFVSVAVALIFNSGCAVVRIPSYRLEECAAEDYSNAPAMMPQVPRIPLPGWLARWKAEKDLPKPPESPRFHPLPTRPMFQPQPANGVITGIPGEAACYGTLPPATSWSEAESVQALPMPMLANPL